MMRDLVWIVSLSKDHHFEPIKSVFKRYRVEPVIFYKESFFDVLKRLPDMADIPILILLDPNLPEKLVDELIQWRTELHWFGDIPSPTITFVADLEPIYQLHKKWDPLDRLDFDFEYLEQLLKPIIAKKKIENSRSIRKAAEYGIIIGESPSIKRLRKFILKLKDTPSTVLIRGESGTGKELVARAIHGNGIRGQNPFVTVNMPALPRELVESWLFGHEKGAFTGADSQKKGQCELAHTGTLFLDEIGTFPLELQPKLLRFLQDNVVQTIGGTTPRTVDVRIITATNSELERMVEEGSFREDLFYRLDVIRIETPPLREHKEDISHLLKHFTLKHYSRLGISKPFDSKAIEALHKYDWPGNVRELENAVERCLVLCDKDTISIDDLPKNILECKNNQNKYFPSIDLPSQTGKPHTKIEFHSLQKSLEEMGWDPQTLLHAIKIPLQIASKKNFSIKERKTHEHLSMAIKICGKNVEEALKLLQSHLNPEGKSRLDPDNEYKDRKRVKLAIEFCRGNIQQTSNLLKLSHYEVNVSPGFIKNRLNLDKSNIDYVIHELARWYKFKYRK